MKTRHCSARSLSGTALLLTAAALPPPAQAGSYTFGSGANSFLMDFVTVGNPGNAPDTTGLPNPAGSVPYTFQMGKYEVSEAMITKANAAGNLGIQRAVIRGANQATTFITWNEAARFVNWLNTSSGYAPAYKFALQPGDVGYGLQPLDPGYDPVLNNIQLWAGSDAGYNAANPFRNSLAHFFLPSEDEWYKAAYYDGVAGVYYDYPTGSDTVPAAVIGGTAPGTTVSNDGVTVATVPADIWNAGGLSPYGTMAQGGNVREWMESAFDRVNDSTTEVRTHRGVYYGRPPEQTVSSRRLAPADGATTSDNCNYPEYERYSIGFRVAAVPEPMESAGVLGVAALAFGLWRRRGAL